MVTTTMSEADLQAGALDIARVLGWRVLHVRPARTAHGWRTPVSGDGVGWPDLFMARGDRLVAVELKSDKGKVTPAQQGWLDALAEAGVDVHVFRPEHYPDRIAEVLR